jgi:predicted GH43/DUF377 family glycosyl hydrolase
MKEFHKRIVVVIIFVLLFAKGAESVEMDIKRLILLNYAQIVDTPELDLSGDGKVNLIDFGEAVVLQREGICIFPFGNCVWEEYTNNPIIVPAGGSEDDNIYAPDVHLEGTIYKMWYGGQGADGHDRIHYATSSDGIHWEKYGVVLDNGNALHVNDPSVVKVGGVYYMYYTKALAELQDVICLATSNDGIHWTDKGVVIDRGPSGSWYDRAVGRPSVIYEDGVFKMWFDGNNGVARHVGYATSADGFNWTIQNSGQPVFLHAGAVDVKHIGSYYVMVHESRDGTKWALGQNETTWQDKGFLFYKSGNSYDAYGHVTPMILLNDEGRWFAVYYGVASHDCWCRNRIAVRYPKK